MVKSSFLYAQEDFTLIYHPIINEAELAIIDSNYVDALDNYKGAFQNVKKPFAKDYYNASICAFYAGKSQLMFDYLEKLAQKGLPFESLKKDTFYKLVIDSSAVWKNFEKHYREIKPLINNTLRDSLVRMNNYRLGQEIGRMFRYIGNTAQGKLELKRIESRLEKGEKLEFRFELAPNILDSIKRANEILYKKLQQSNTETDSVLRIFQNKLIKTQERNYQALLKIIDEYDFPDENLVGATSVNSENSLVMEILLKNAGRIAFRHDHRSIFLRDSTEMPREELVGIAMNGVRTGKILPKTAQELLEYYELNRNVKEKSVISPMLEVYHSGHLQFYKIKLEDNVSCAESIWGNKKDKWLFKKETFENYTTAQIDEIRARIGLENLSDCYRKLVYKRQMPFFELGSGSSANEFSYVASCELLEKLLKSFEVLPN